MSPGLGRGLAAPAAPPWHDGLLPRGRRVFGGRGAISLGRV